jgi:hypothetical protein
MNSEEIQISSHDKRTGVDSEGSSVSDLVATGQWYWVKSKDGDSESRWLGCITHVGSNYAELAGPAGYHGGQYRKRVHFDVFNEICTAEPDAQRIIAQKIESHRLEACRLMEKVQDVTRRLAITPKQSLSDGSETQALALRSGQQPIKEYKQALIKAQEKTLPELFKQIKEQNEAMGSWMQAPLLAMEAELEALEPAIKAIKSRIFNVELYAGLTEQVEQIADGEPADLSEPVHLFQRRAYMDEECLAEYESGGMEFKNIKAFDKWMIKPQHRDRLLPFPRCVLAFQVRRLAKEREGVSLSDFIRIHFEEQMDKLTFLYIRNGDQIFRLNTSIDFGAQLFPDMDRSNLDGVIYAKMFASSVDELISEGAYLDMVERDRIAREEHERKVAQTKKKDRWKFGSYWGLDHDRYIRWTPDNVYYDDIAEYVKAQIDAHNRLVLVLQGLLDRSPVFHPHPPWQLWTYEGFNQAFRLIYDDSRALTDGDKPDFEAYRARLNASLKVGSITVGQEDYWERHEAVKECARLDASYWRHKSEYRPKRYHPEGNPGPGRVAVVRKVSQTKGCIYRWERERAYRRSRYWQPEGSIPCSIAVPTTELLHVDAYKKNDFKIFYSDPRTRADYLQWSFLLLTCEEYLAGNKKCQISNEDRIEINKARLAAIEGKSR